MTDLMDERVIDNRFIKEKTAKGTFLSSVFSVLGIVINLIGSLVLVRLLSPVIFGAFAVIVFIVQQIPAVLYDLGLPDALVQKKEPPTDNELSSVFAVNLIMVVLFIFLIYIFSPIISEYYKIELLGSSPFRIFSLILFGFLLETIPNILLRRRIGFNLLTIVSLVGIISFNISAIILVFYGFGLMGLVWATLISRLVALIVLYRFQTWTISFKIDISCLQNLLKFGLPFRGVTLVGLLGLAIVPTLVGSKYGLEAVGYFSFSDRITGLITLFPLILNSILFSTFSRSQDKPELFVKIIEKSTQWICFAIFPIITLAIFLGREIITYVFTDKWITGIWVYYFSLLIAGLGIISGIYFQALFSKGKAKMLFKITLINVSLQWLFSIILSNYFSYNGVAFAKFIAAFTLLIPLFILRKEIGTKIINNSIPYFLAALTAGLVTRYLSGYFMQGLFGLIIMVAFGLMIYLLILAPFKGKNLLKDGKSLTKLVLMK